MSHGRPPYLLQSPYHLSAARNVVVLALLLALCCRRPNRKTGRYGVFTASRSVYSALMLAARITLAHLSVSLAMSLPNSPGFIDNGMPPRSAIRAFILGSSRAALVSLLSRSMISAGVSLGATIPCQPLASYPGTKSPTVGMSGSAPETCGRG